MSWDSSNISIFIPQSGSGKGERNSTSIWKCFSLFFLTFVLVECSRFLFLHCVPVWETNRQESGGVEWCVIAPPATLNSYEYTPSTYLFCHKHTAFSFSRLLYSFIPFQITGLLLKMADIFMFFLSFYWFSRFRLCNKALP